MATNPKQKRILTSIDYIGQVVNQCAREILKFTPQLYVKESNKTTNIKPDPNASGVLLKVKGQYYLITAGHVLQGNNPEDIGIMIDSTFHILNGFVKYVNPSESKEADKVDIAVWKLDDIVARDLETRYQFLTFEKIDYQHEVDSGSKYLIVGFPWRETKEDKASKKLKVTSFIFLTKEAGTESYKQLKFEKHSNLLLDYRQKKVKNFDTGHVQQNKSPEGISGCGVRYIPKYFNPKGRVPDFKLIGHVIEQNKEKTILIATRIHLVTEVLRRDFGLDIPPSTITKLEKK